MAKAVLDLLNRKDRAEATYKKALAKYWDYLGWGTSQEISEARAAADKAKEALTRAERALQGGR